MKAIIHTPAVAFVTFTAASLLAQATPEDALYLNQAAKYAQTSFPEQDEIIRFEADVTGDQKPEVFYTKASLRDGKHGYLWSIYDRLPSGSLHLIGEVTFSDGVFTPSVWKADPQSHGFYTFYPSGAAQGSLAFFEVTTSGISRRESRKISPNSGDKEEFDSLFAAQFTGEAPGLGLKRTKLPKQQSGATSDTTVPEPLDTRQPAPTLNPPSPQSQAPKKPTEQKPALPTPVEEPTPPTRWPVVTAVVVIVAALGQLWVLLKKRK